MAVDSIDFDELQVDDTLQEANLLDCTGVEWRGRSVKQVVEDSRIQAIQESAFTKSPQAAEAPKKLDANQFTKFDPVAAEHRALIAADKKKKKKNKRRKWWIIGAIVVAAIAVVAITGGVASGATTAAAAGAASAGAVSSSSRRDKEHRTAPPPPRSSSPPPPPFQAYNGPSAKKTFEIPGKKLVRGGVGGINGIGNSLDQAQANATYLSKLSDNHHLDWVYNRSHTTPLDILEVIALNYKGMSAPAQDLKNNWMKFHKEHLNDPDAKYLQYCHSQGALHVKNALQEAPQELRDRVIVVAIAPAAVVPKNLCFASFNYASQRDPVPYGAAAFSYDADASYEERMAEPNRQALKELILLDPHPDASGIDHNFDSPTFTKTISDHLEAHIEKYGGAK